MPPGFVKIGTQRFHVHLDVVKLAAPTFVILDAQRRGQAVEPRVAGAHDGIPIDGRQHGVCEGIGQLSLARRSSAEPFQIGDAAAGYQQDVLMEHQAFGDIDLVGHGTKRRQLPQVLLALRDFGRAWLGGFQIGQVRRARDMFDHDTDQPLDEGAAAADMPAQAMAGQQVLPGFVVSALTQMKHGPRRERAGKLPAFLDAGHQSAK